MGTAGQESHDNPQAAMRGLHLSARAVLATSLAMAIALLVLGLMVDRQQALGGGLKALVWCAWGWSVVVLACAAFALFRARNVLQAAAVDWGLMDLLTRLLNYRGLVNVLRELARGSSEAILLVDVELLELKRVNHEFGRAAGDTMLREVADLLRRLVPRGKPVGRLAGDEFLIIVPKGGPDAASSLAGDVERALSDYRLDLEDRGEVRSPRTRVTVTTYVADGPTLLETVTSAKAAGVERNAAPGEAEDG